MKKFLVFCLAALSLTGCEFKIENLNVYLEKGLNYNSLDGSAQVVPPGNYSPNSSITFKKNDWPMIELINSVTWQKYWIKTNVPAELQNPNFQGPVDLTPAQTGQPFGLKGFVKINDTTSGPFRGTRQCIYDSYVDRECGWETRWGQIPHCRRHGNPCWGYVQVWVCHDYVRYIYGRKDLEWYSHSRSRQTQLNFIQDNSAVGEISKFEDLGNTETISYQGPCIRN